MYLANPVAGAAGGVTAATMGAAAPGSLLVMELGKLGRPGILGTLGNPGIFGKDRPDKDKPPT